MNVLKFVVNRLRDFSPVIQQMNEHRMKRLKSQKKLAFHIHHIVIIFKKYLPLGLTSYALNCI